MWTIEYYQTDITRCFQSGMILNQFNHPALKDISFGFTIGKHDSKSAVCFWRVKTVKK